MTKRELFSKNFSKDSLIIISKFAIFGSSSKQRTNKKNNAEIYSTLYYLE